MRISVLVVAVSIVTTAFVHSDVAAQSAGAEQSSAVMFDINFEKLKKSKLASTLGIQHQQVSPKLNLCRPVKCRSIFMLVCSSRMRWVRTK
jgi:hypothetical protein